MRSISRSFLSLFAVTALFLAAPAFADDSGGLTNKEKTEVQSLIQDYIKDNPEKIFEALLTYQQKQREDAENLAKGKIPEHLPYLSGTDMPSAGNPQGDVTVIEFFDYNCGYCKHAISDIKQILDKDKNVRFVFHDMPILGETSGLVARWANAAGKQGKFFEFHQAAMEHSGGFDEAVLSNFAKDLKLDVERMKKDAADPAIDEAISKAMSAGREMGIQGTPAFIINGKLYPGYLGEDGLKKAIEEARAAPAAP